MLMMKLGQSKEARYKSISRSTITLQWQQIVNNDNDNDNGAIVLKKIEKEYES